MYSPPKPAQFSLDFYSQGRNPALNARSTHDTTRHATLFGRYTADVHFAVIAFAILDDDNAGPSRSTPPPDLASVLELF